MTLLHRFNRNCRCDSKCLPSSEVKDDHNGLNDLLMTHYFKWPILLTLSPQGEQLQYSGRRLM